MRGGYRFWVRPPAVTFETSLHPLYDFFNRRRSSVDLQVHGLLLVMRKPPEFRPHKTAAKNLLRPLPDSVRLDCHIALTELQFLEGPLRRVFFFLGHWISFGQSVVSTEGPDPESDWPSQSLPDSLSLGKHDTTFRLSFSNSTTCSNQNGSPRTM